MAITVLAMTIAKAVMGFFKQEMGIFKPGISIIKTGMRIIKPGMGIFALAMNFTLVPMPAKGSGTPVPMRAMTGAVLKTGFFKQEMGYFN